MTNAFGMNFTRKVLLAHAKSRVTLVNAKFQGAAPPAARGGADPAKVTLTARAHAGKRTSD
eukprot:6173160-Pleurochrysis_carterae.AAC.2